PSDPAVEIGKPQVSVRSCRDSVRKALGRNRKLVDSLCPRAQRREEGDDEKHAASGHSPATRSPPTKACARAREHGMSRVLSILPAIFNWDHSLRLAFLSARSSSLPKCLAQRLLAAIC